MKRLFMLPIAGLFGLAAATSVMPASAAGNAHPTIRAMAGAEPIRALDARSTALLVIDFQNEYFAGGKMPIPDGASAMAHSRRLMDFADRHHIRVIHVRHVLPVGAPVFAQDSVTSQFHAAMQPRAGELVVSKDQVSVFAGASGPVLTAALQAAGITTLLVTGLQTHACVAGAARDAAAQGYAVLVSSDGSATRDLDLRTGAKVSHQQLHAAALAEIEDTFGDVMTTDQIVALPVR